MKGALKEGRTSRKGGPQGRGTLKEGDPLGRGGGARKGSPRGWGAVRKEGPSSSVSKPYQEYMIIGHTVLVTSSVDTIKTLCEGKKVFF